jgi:hypothetical protein
MGASSISSERGRLGRKLVIAGIVVSMAGVIGYLAAGMHAALYVPICQPGEHWSGNGACAVLKLRVLAMVGVLGVGIAITFAGFVRAQRERREGRPPSGSPRASEPARSAAER